MGRLTRKQLADHYRVLRSEARHITSNVLVAEGMKDIRLTEINRQALHQAGQWVDRKVDWDWDEMQRRWAARPRHISLAIWVDPALCCLLLGRITEGRVIARIDRLERAPNVTRAQFASAIVVARAYLDTLGRLVGCRQAVLWEPFPTLIEHYKLAGFTSEIVRKGKIVGLKYDLV
jgi:hypothetical protein